jgi:methyltransferase (TIGR00027 family)
MQPALIKNDRSFLEGRMKIGQASRTAEYNALFRALESARAPQCRIIEDQLATLFLRQPLRSVTRVLHSSALATVSRYIDRRQPGVRPTVVARTRLIDDYLIAAVRDGISQIVILGAGFDTRAYRIAGIEGACVFEVDHPDTSAVKQQRIRQVLGELPAHVRYLTMDFDNGSLDDALTRAGFDAAYRTFFIWEGVTNYLTEDAVNATLAVVSKASEGSRLVFTYVHHDILRNPERFAGGVRLHRRLSRFGEQFTFGLDPAHVSHFLAAHGLRLIDDIGSVEYRARFLGARGDHLKGHEFYHVAVADVGNAKIARSSQTQNHEAQHA